MSNQLMSNQPISNQPTHPHLGAHLTARSYLFVPAIDIHRVPKAFARGADAVIIDLEDAVSESVKNPSRQNVVDYLNQPNAVPVWVRINASHSPHQDSDIQWLKGLPNILGIVIPKVESSLDIERVRHALAKPIIALIESAIGMVNIAEIATAQGLTALSYGFLDICQDFGTRSDSEAGQMLANQIRYQLLLHSRINHLIAPIECVYPPFHDNDGLTKRVQGWRDLGFSGMLCIHPNQLAIVHKYAKPTTEQLAFAKQVVAHYQATGLSAFAIEGEMVDTPVIIQAQKLLTHYR